MPHLIVLIVLLLLSLFGLSTNLFAQNAEQKTQELIAALGKTKYKKKEKKNFSFEHYVDVKSEAVVRQNARDYAGIYESSPADYRLELRVSADGRAEGSGHDSNFSGSGRRQSFTLRDARIQGALLTATKVFADGTTRRLEAVFNNRTVSQGSNPNAVNSRETKYGLGFIDSSGEWTNRVFLEFKP